MMRAAPHYRLPRQICRRLGAAPFSKVADDPALIAVSNNFPPITVRLVQLINKLMQIAIDRRRSLALLGGAAAWWAVTPRARPSGRGPLVGFLLGLADDNEARARIGAFEHGLAEQGWRPGRDVTIEYRFASGDAARMHAFAADLVRLRPDVLVGHSTPVVNELFNATKTIPIVAVVVADPVGSGFAASISRPGGNVTGFTNLNPSIPGKLLTILKQITPNLRHVALLFNPNTVARGDLFDAYLRAFKAAAAAFAVDATLAQVRTPAEIEDAIGALGRLDGAGLVVMPDNYTTVHRARIVALTTQSRVPAIFPYRYFVDAGGLVSYGVDVIALFRRAAEYVSRILHGETPGELPIQAPTTFELVINLRTARALGAVVPKILLAGANDLIE